MSAPLLLQGTALALPLRDASVQCCITSPPYYGLRDYGTATWAGGDPACDHRWKVSHASLARSTLDGGKKTTAHQQQGYAGHCGRCGATRVDAQIGLEDTLEAYLAALVAVFREVWRVLHPSGTMWINISDSYNAHPGQRSSTDKAGPKQCTNNGSVAIGSRHVAALKPKDLCMVPARLALALQAEGWTLRSEIVWAKPNPMPESVTDRPTRSHEMVYLFSKQPRYFYDAPAIAEPSTGLSGGGFSRAYAEAQPSHGAMALQRPPDMGTRNARSVWSLATEPTSFAHFATMPTELVRRCILAGTSAYGCCAACGAPWKRGIERTEQVATSHNGSYFDRGKSAHHGHVQEGPRYVSVPADWHPTCACNAPVQPCTILDPFCGSGTTLLVARELGRQSIGLDLSYPYLHDIARQRLGLSQLAAWEGRNGHTPATPDYTALPLFAGGTS